MDFDGRRKFKEEKDCVQTRTSLAEIGPLFHIDLQIPAFTIAISVCAVSLIKSAM